MHIYNIHCFNFTVHLILTEVRSKRRFLPLIFIVKITEYFAIYLETQDTNKQFKTVKLTRHHRK